MSKDDVTMPEGKKCFSVVKSVPVVDINRHTALLRDMFRSAVRDIIPLECKADIRVEYFVKVTKVTFTVIFGEKLLDTECMSQIVSDVADVAIIELHIDNHIKEKQKLQAKAVRNSVIYKPKVIQKIC